MPTPFFADLVRELCQEGGAGPLTPTGAVPGHRRFSDAVPADTSFHYAIAGVAHPAQWEVGLGRIDEAGRLVRDSVAASSASDAPVDFAPGLKTIALTVGADWFGDTDIALGGKQPLSTLHAPAATGVSGDSLTVRRGTGWVNIPLATLPYLSAGGQHGLSGPLVALSGTAAAPTISFSGDLDTGLFRPGTDTVSIATGGVERARINSNGLGLSITPAVRLHVHSSLAEAVRIETPQARGAGSIYQSWFDSTGRKGYFGYGGVTDALFIMNEMNAVVQIGTNGAQRLVIQADGHMRPGADNSQTLGAASFRWSVVYAGTGTINTSDAGDKEWRGGFTPAELAAARRIAGEIGVFRWLAAVAEKGDAARIHIGVRAQAVWAIMADEGLIEAIDEKAVPSSRYGFLCYDEWEDEAETQTAAGDRFGIRPDQLALFLIAAQEARIAALEVAQ